MKVALAHQNDTGRERRHHGADDLRPRLLERLAHDAHAELERGAAREADLKAVAGEIDIVRRIALPYRQDYVDRVSEDLIAVLIENTDRFAIGGQRTWAHAHHETPLREMIEHRGVYRDYYRMHLREVGSARSELDGLGVVDQRGLEQHAVGDVLAGIGQVLADEG